MASLPTSSTPETRRCPCGSGAAFPDCCGRFLSRRARAATAEELMRSRYAAYVEGDINYILDTHDPETVDTTDRESAAKWSERAEWLGLQVLSTERGGADDHEGFVEFVARYSMDGTVQTHRELSRFRKLRGRWLYVDGEMGKAAPVVREGPKVGRNEPCPCGSGKKHKKCCGK